MPARLGQHFLTNPRAVAAAASALEIEAGDTVIEIGPGRGALTLPLARRAAACGARLIGIERDARLADAARRVVADANLAHAVQIVTGDVRRVLAPRIAPLASFKLAGNIPYYLSGYLLRTMSVLTTQPSRAVLMLQAEVAERLTAKPPRMNMLAAATQFWSEPRILMRLQPSDFAPAPKVRSALILLTRRRWMPSVAFQAYEKVIRVIFRQPRKTILNNLVAGLTLPKSEIISRLAELSLTGTERPGSLSLDLLINIAKICG